MKNSISQSPSSKGSRAASGWLAAHWTAQPWTARGGAGMFRTREQITGETSEGAEPRPAHPDSRRVFWDRADPAAGLWANHSSGRGRGPARGHALLAGARHPKLHSGGSQVSPAGTEVAPPSSLSLGTPPRANWGGGPRPARRGAAHPWAF